MSAQKIRTEEWLKAAGAVDLTPRFIKVDERIEVKCQCGLLGVSKAGNLDQNIKKKGHGYKCKDCGYKSSGEKASKRIGDKNHFYGKSHSKDTKEILSTYRQGVWEKASDEDRKKARADMVRGVETKYGGNAMFSPDVRVRHKESVNTPEYIEDKKNQENRATDHLLAASFEFWKSEKGRERAAVQSELWRQTRNKPGTPEYEKRVQGHFKMWSDANRVNAALQKMAVTCMEKYGAENWQQSTEAAEYFKNHPELFTSKGETQVKNWIESLGIRTYKDRRGSNEIDIFLPDFNIGIEFNGLYWHSDVYKKTRYHLNKTIECAKQGTQLFHIFENEWRDRQDQVKSFLGSKFNKSRTVGARECLFETIEGSTARPFLERYHIQGSSVGSKLYVGAYYDDELVAVSAFGGSRYNADRMEMQRFCGKDGISVSGALSKFSKMGSEALGDLVSWCDLRWSQGKGYLASGWKLESIDPPSYVYTNGRTIKDSSSYEEEFAPEERKWFRVYDCGKMKMIYKKSTNGNKK